MEYFAMPKIQKKMEEAVSNIQRTENWHNATERCDHGGPAYLRKLCNNMPTIQRSPKTGFKDKDLKDKRALLLMLPSGAAEFDLNVKWKTPTGLVLPCACNGPKAQVHCSKADGVRLNDKPHVLRSIGDYSAANGIHRSETSKRQSVSNKTAAQRKCLLACSEYSVRSDDSLASSQTEIHIKASSQVRNVALASCDGFERGPTVAEPVRPQVSSASLMYTNRRPRGQMAGPPRKGCGRRDTWKMPRCCTGGMKKRRRRKGWAKKDGGDGRSWRHPRKEIRRWKMEDREGCMEWKEEKGGDPAATVSRRETRRVVAGTHEKKRKNVKEKGGLTTRIPSHGRLLCAHWSHACLLVVARVAAAVPFHLPGALRVIAEDEEESVFSEAWHLLTCRERRSERANWSPQWVHL
ncbi:hypothetical protein FB451DRAFT_1373935 [Mycena latifolia]|nr:hypothetical protein FB451DRAFT_1373935 [Mycena latifolia]